MPDTDDRPTGTPPPLLPGVFRMTVGYEFSGATAANILYFVCHETAGVSDADVLAMLTDLGHAWRDDVWKPFAANEWSVTSYKVVYASIEGAPNVKRAELADATAGLASTDADYAQVAYLINWATGDPRRGGKPRTYLPGATQTDGPVPGAVVAAHQTAINSGIVTFLAHAAGATHGNLVCDGLVEYSTVSHKAFRAAGVTFPIGSGNCNGIVATQRRRVDRLRL